MQPKADELAQSATQGDPNLKVSSHQLLEMSAGKTKEEQTVAVAAK